MFKAATYVARRKILRRSVGSGLMVFLANEESPMNYPANTYHYRQDSSFLYFFGLASPGLAAIVDADENTDTLYGDDIGIEDIIWMGQLPKLKDRALAAGSGRSPPGRPSTRRCARPSRPGAPCTTCRRTGRTTRSP